MNDLKSGEAVNFPQNTKQVDINRALIELQVLRREIQQRSEKYRFDPFLRGMHDEYLVKLNKILEGCYVSIREAREDLYQDFLELGEKYQERLPLYEFGFALIEYCSKMLMDVSPSHNTAIETIKQATEKGIKWSLEERKDVK